MFAPFAHIKGCLFTLYNLAFGYTTYIMSRFNLNTYLQLVAANKVGITSELCTKLRFKIYYNFFTTVPCRCLVLRVL